MVRLTLLGNIWTFQRHILLFKHKTSCTTSKTHQTIRLVHRRLFVCLRVSAATHSVLSLPVVEVSKALLETVCGKWLSDSRGGSLYTTEIKCGRFCEP